MTPVFIASVIVLVLLIGFIAAAIRLVAGNADKQINTYFLRKLEDYDQEFQNKMDRLNELQDQKVQLELDLEELRFEKKTLETSRFYKPRPIINDTYIPVAHYVDSSFFENYKLAKQMLNLDIEAIIKKILEENPYKGNLARYQTASKIKDLLNYQAIYDMSTIPGEDQMQVLLQVLMGDEMMLLLDYIKELKPGETFAILEFIKWLDSVLRKETPLLMAYFAQPSDYNYIDENVRCEVDENVCDGVRVIYQGVLYDYSIYEKRGMNFG